jgi:DNA-binding protein H-NS
MNGAGDANAKPQPKGMSVDALLKLRGEIEKVLAQRATQLRDELYKLGGGSLKRGHPLKGRKAPVKYRDRAGNARAGRGARPRWLVAKLKAGAKLKDFAVKR